MLRRVALVRTDVSEEPGASFIRVTRIGELGATRRNIPEDTFLHSHRRENLKSYKNGIHRPKPFVSYRMQVGSHKTDDCSLPQFRLRHHWSPYDTSYVWFSE
jgi:hypothetical protein